MKYRKLGKTGWNVSVLGFAASPLGGVFGPITEKKGLAAVHAAIDLGINLIDVSPYYGLTQAETLLGKALKTIPREKYFLATKIGRYGPAPADLDYSAARVERSVNESLRRLKVAHLDIVSCQDIEFASIDQIVHETLPALEKLKTQGKLRRVGITGLPLKAFKSVLDQSSVDIVQSYCRYCLMDITLVQLLPYIKSRGAGVVNAAPLALGLLSESGPPDWHPAPARTRAVCEKAVEFCKKKKESIAQLALQFAVGNPDIACTLVGTAAPSQLRQYVKWIDERLDVGLLFDVQQILKPIQNNIWPSGRSENN